MESPEKALSQLHETLENYFRALRFARATEMARCGRFLEAEGLLSPDGRESSDPKELDLLARIAAQQQKYDRARRLWEQALQRSSDHALYERSIERTKEAKVLRERAQIGMIIATAVLATVVAVFLTYTFIYRPRAEKDDEKPPHSTAEAKPPASSQPVVPKSPDGQKSAPSEEKK